LSNPIQVTAVVALTLKNSGITAWTDTVGKRMGGVRGEIYLEDGVYYLKEVASTTEFPGPQEGLLALSNSQVDFLMMNLVQAGYYMENSPQADSLALISDPPLALYPESLCVNAQEPDLLTAINILLGNYRSDGSYAKVVMEFMGNTEMLDGLPLMGY
jgi:ABC-type amino acid transport substrate-binding protein